MTAVIIWSQNDNLLKTLLFCILYSRDVLIDFLLSVYHEGNMYKADRKKGKF